MFTGAAKLLCMKSGLKLITCTTTEFVTVNCPAYKVELKVGVLPSKV